MHFQIVYTPGCHQNTRAILLQLNRLLQRTLFSNPCLPPWLPTAPVADNDKWAAYTRVGLGIAPTVIKQVNKSLFSNNHTDSG